MGDKSEEIPMVVDEPQPAVISVAPRPVTVSKAGVTIIPPSNVVLSISSPPTARLIQTVPKVIASGGGGAKSTYQVVRLVTPAQQKQLLGKQVAPVRLVTTTNPASGASRIQILPSTTVTSAKTLHQRPATVTVQQRPATGVTIQQKPLSSQRLILPATQPNNSPQILTIPFTQTAPSLQPVLTTGAPGATVIAPKSIGATQQVLAILSPHKTGVPPHQQTVRVVAHSAPSPNKTIRLEPNIEVTKQEPTVIKKEPTAESNQRKPCNCTKSHCLKLYCDCFAKGEFCSNCNCVGCMNILSKEEQRQKAIKQCLLRNPYAFHPKIGKGNSARMRSHRKGCNCKRSGCLKNYCECFEAKIMCGTMCKCVGCKNCEENTTTGVSLMSLADAAMVRTMQQSNVSDKLSQPLRPGGSLGGAALQNNNSELIKSHLTTDIIEGMLDCLLTQCHEAEAAKCKPQTTQKLILEEFGRCVTRVIHSASTDDPT